MAREKEMQEFTRSFFRSRPDLSTLTHSIVRQRFLAYAGRDHLEPEEKQTLKRLVEEELVKMQVDEGGTREDKLDLTGKAKRPPTPCSDSERKRPRFNSGSEPSSAASSPDCFGRPAENGMSGAQGGPGKEEAKSPGPTSKAAESSDDQEQQEDLGAEAGLEASSEEEEEEEGRVGTREEEEEEDPKGRTRKKAVAKSKQAAGKASARRKQAREESEDELAQQAAKKGAQSPRDSGRESEEEGEGEEEDWKQQARSSRGKRPAREERRLTGDSGDSGEGQIHEAAGGGSGSGSDGSDDEPLARRGKAGAQGQDGDETRTAAESPAAGAAGGEDSDLEREGSDSEAGGSLKERKNRSSKKSSKRGRTRSSSSSSDGSPEPKGGKAGAARRGEDHPAVARLKRYIRACGAHRNYKKLLGSCRSHKERLSVLRAELEALGMKGNPSLEKCRALKEQREAAAEVASLDVANIISGSGRPRRRTAWNPTAAAPGELYRRTLDSEEEGPRLAPTDWSHMRGIISSDGDST